MFRDLIARIGRIATLDDAERTRLMREGKFANVAARVLRWRGRRHVRARGKVPRPEESAVRSSFTEIDPFSPERQRKTMLGQSRPSSPLHSVAKQAGDQKLALVTVDMAEAGVTAERERLDSDTSAELIDSTRKSRSKLLGEIFEALMSTEKAAELLQLAKSQAGFAIARGDKKAFGQCLSWISVAALLMKNFELALEQASDAIMVARASNDVYQTGVRFFLSRQGVRRLGSSCARLRMRSSML